MKGYHVWFSQCLVQFLKRECKHCWICNEQLTNELDVSSHFFPIKDKMYSHISTVNLRQ